jgi:hypothetical protein
MTKDKLINPTIHLKHLHLRADLEKYPPIHNNIAKVMFEWCEKYGLEGREKSRFIDGVKLGVALVSKNENKNL